MQHSHVDVCETLFDVVEANEQQNESLEFVNPPDSCRRLVAHFAAIPAFLLVIPDLVDFRLLSSQMSLIPASLICNRCHRSMAGEYDGFFWERHQLILDAGDECMIVTAEQVAAPAASCE